MLEIHRQTCQKCGCRNMRNLLVREPGESDKVYIQCIECDELVARYVIAPHGYYHHGKGFESYLRGLVRGGDLASAQDLQNEFENIQEKCLKEFKKVLAKDKERRKKSQ